MSTTPTLSVTSPMTVGPRVTAAQRVLNGHNVFGKDFLDGVVDGQWGPQSGAAAVHAKQFLGYALKDQRPTYGEMLDDLLKGKRLIPDEFKRRSEAVQQKKVELRDKMLRLALKQVGTKESPMGSNNVEYSRWYMQSDGSGWTTQHPGPAWCAMFGTWVAIRCGSKAYKRGVRWAYVPYFVADARRGTNGLKAISSSLVLPGDQIAYDWDGGVADHYGMFKRWLEKGTTFEAVEGNTAIGNDSNGGQVMERERKVSQVEQFVRVMR
jgi:hypothetical protein